MQIAVSRVAQNHLACQADVSEARGASDSVKPGAQAPGSCHQEKGPVARDSGRQPVNLTLSPVSRAPVVVFDLYPWTWIGSVQGAVATLSNDGNQESLETLHANHGPGRYRSLY